MIKTLFVVVLVLFLILVIAWIFLANQDQNRKWTYVLDSLVLTMVAIIVLGAVITGLKTNAGVEEGVSENTISEDGIVPPNNGGEPVDNTVIPAPDNVIEPTKEPDGNIDVPIGVEENPEANNNTQPVTEEPTENNVIMENPGDPTITENSDNTENVVPEGNVTSGDESQPETGENENRPPLENGGAE